MSTLTTLGTPCAHSWTNDWLAAVNEKETELNRRICGARLPDATPCTNESGHSSGRCPFHGGFDLTGAPPGNRNAVIHGLYTRRLRPCTPACPYYQTCPLANQDLCRRPRESGDPSSLPSSIPQSEIRNPQSNSLQSHPSSDSPDQPDQSNSSDSSYTSHPSGPTPPTIGRSAIRPVRRCISKHRTLQSETPLQTSTFTLQTSSPTCPYQLAEYNTVVTDALAVVESQPHANPMGIHAAHNVAMLQVLVNAAAAHLAQAADPWQSDDAAQNPNPSAVIAFTRLMREFRANLKLLHVPTHPPLFRQNNNGTPPSPDGILRHAQRAQHDTGLDPDSIAAAQIPPQTTEAHAKAYVQRAALAGGQGRDVEMCEAFDNAALLDEAYAESERDHVLASYRPAKQSVSEELAKLILGNLHLPPLPIAHQHSPDTSTPRTVHAINEESDKLLQEYLDSFRAGKIPPEAFPIGSPRRAYAESIYTGPPTTYPESDSEATPE